VHLRAQGRRPRGRGRIAAKGRGEGRPALALAAGAAAAGAAPGRPRERIPRLRALELGCAAQGRAQTSPDRPPQQLAVSLSTLRSTRWRAPPMRRALSVWGGLGSSRAGQGCHSRMSAARGRLRRQDGNTSGRARRSGSLAFAGRRDASQDGSRRPARGRPLLCQGCNSRGALSPVDLTCP